MAGDVVLFVTPDTVDVHVGPEAYEIVRPVAAVWSRATKITVRALPPRRVAAAERDAETRAEAKRREEARRREARLEGGDVETREEEDANEAPTEEDASNDASAARAPRFGSSESDADDDSEEEDSSDDDEDEDAAQDFKLESFVDVFVGVEKIGISVVVPYDTADAVSSANIPRDPFLAAAEIERWPLAMAYGLEGVGRSGFFTMNFEVKDVCDTLRRTCYARLDRAALTRELDHNVPQFVAQWLDVADALEEASAGKRASLFSPGRTFDSREKKTNERAFAEALFDFFEYGSLRTPVGLRPACAVLDAPLVTLEDARDGRGDASEIARRKNRAYVFPRRRRAPRAAAADSSRTTGSLHRATNARFGMRHTRMRYTRLSSPARTRASSRRRARRRARSSRSRAVKPNHYMNHSPKTRAPRFRRRRKPRASAAPRSRGSRTRSWWKQARHRSRAKPWRS